MRKNDMFNIGYNFGIHIFQNCHIVDSGNIIGLPDLCNAEHLENSPKS